jgi:hypothetical protein
VAECAPARAATRGPATRCNQDENCSCSYSTRKGPSISRGPSRFDGASKPRLIAAASPASCSKLPLGINRKAKAWLSYFFLVGFLVAFFFIVLFSLGLDLVAAVPGFFIAAIRVPPIGSLLPDEHQNLSHAASAVAHYRNLLCGDQAVRSEI